MAKTKPIVLMLGDSLAAGYGVEPEQSFPSLIQRELDAMGKKVKIINGGISGSTSASAVGRLKWYLRARPNILVLELGANDGLRGLNIAARKKNLAKTISIAKKRGMRVLLAGMKMPLNYGDAYTQQFERAYFELAKEYQIPMIPFLLDHVAGKAELNQSDGIHPTAEGHQIISKTVLKYLQPLLDLP